MIRTGKFNNKIVKTVDGTFHSQGEWMRWNTLKILERAGEIRELTRQVKFPLIVNDELVCTYIADFMYIDMKTLAVVVEDFKGMRLPEYRLKAKLMHAILGITILETSAPRKRR